MKSCTWNLNATKIKKCIEAYDFYLREQGLHQLIHKSGQWAVAGLCPFHKDSSVGSFKVNLETGGFICFSCGEKGGDIISFLQKRDNLSFREALEQLTTEWRVL